MAAHVLLVSPIPSHPQDQGNSARIFTIGRLLQRRGYVVHFLYYQMEGLTQDQLRAMQASWDFVHTVPCAPRSMAPTGEGTYRLDDWDDPLVGEAAAVLHKRFRYQAVIANYVWFSAVLQRFGQDVLKVLDTHDVFGGRDERFMAAGLTPEWYFTTNQEEARGLARADVVLAIQDEEAEHFRSLGHPRVLVLGHMLGLRSRPEAKPVTGPLRVGYFGSGNPLNLSSFAAVQERLKGRSSRARLDFLVCGSICDKLVADIRPFRSLGRVEHVDDFYDQVDIVINPMQMGTGLKIKSVEAVFEGLPLIATSPAMIGLQPTHRLHTLDGAAQVAESLVSEPLDASLVAELTEASIACARAYASQVRTGFADLDNAIKGKRVSSAKATPLRGVTVQ